MEKNPTHFEKHRHAGLFYLEDGAAEEKIVLVGNPNVGKSVIFNEMTRMNAEISNYPGTTVELLKGTFGKYVVYDTPGVYGISSFNDEEKVTRDVVLEADVVFNVVDAMHLERDLFLTQQLIDMGKRVVVFLNFMDEVKKLRLEIDIEKLSLFLGVIIIPVTAVKGVGKEILFAATNAAREGVQLEELHSHLHETLNRVGSQAEALLVAEGDPYVAERHGVQPENKRDELYIYRRNRVNYIVNTVLKDVSPRKLFSDLLGRWAVKPLTGIPLLMLALYGAYLFVGKFVAQDLVDFTENEIGQHLWEPWIRDMVTGVIPYGSRWNEIFVGEFGVITLTTTYLLFLLLPLVTAFYVVLAILEDSGYLPRLATMVDRVLSYLGLNGRAVIPLILGFGCITSATITTRLLNSEREKTIATAILQFAIPCSAQMAVIAALLAGAGFGPLILYTIVILTVLITIGTVLNRMLKGESSPLLLDLPPMRVPRVRNIVRKTRFRTFHFMKEASGWFFIGSLAVGVAQSTGVLQFLQNALVPVVTHWLQLPPEAATAFIMGVVRRDFGAAGLYHMTLTPVQITVALIVITLFVPCIASLMVMMKERGWKEGFAIWIGTWVVAFAVGGIVSQVVM
jgi:ferrous iron transport protein B